MTLPSKTSIIPTVIIIAAVVYLISSGFTQSMVYYYTVEEFQSQMNSLGDRGIRISGIATAIDAQARICRFEVVGESQNLEVVYRGLLPDTFKEGAEVVIEGRWDPEARHFEAGTLLAKCPSKYEKADPEESPVS